MKKSFLILVLLLLCMHGFAAGKGFVAEPYRGVRSVWKSYPVAGKDFWLLLDCRWDTLKGVAHEKFVKNSGTGFIHQGIVGKNFENLRVLTLREISCYDAAGKKVKVSVKVIPAEKDTFVGNVKNLYDGKKMSFCVISGDIHDVRHRYGKVSAKLQITGERPFSKIVIEHGYRGKNSAAAIICGGKKITGGKSTNTVKLAKAVKTCDITVDSHMLKYAASPISKSYHARMKRAPFIIIPPFRHNRDNVLGLRAENIDRKSFVNAAKGYEKNFLGYWLPEWDSNLFQTMVRPGAAYFRTLQNCMKIPCNKEEMIGNMRILWEAHRTILGDQLLGLSGQVHFMHHACDWGSTVSAIELTQERSEHAGRISMMFTRGASRQFEKPMMVYQAYYGGSSTPNSTLRGGKHRLDWGVAPSLVHRNFYTGYYMGNNYLDFEAQPYGMVKEEKNGLHSLTANGKAMKDIYEWTNSPKGKRGTCYTPILLLADRKHGYDMWVRIHSRGWGNWYNLYPLSDANWLLEYVMQVISPRYDYYKYDDPRYSGNLRNSAVGDIFDLYIANPQVTGEVRLEQLEKYPVVFLIDDITYTASMVKTLKQYVANGGTLILTSGQSAPFEEDSDFLGVKISKKTFKADNLLLNSVTLLPGTRVLMKSSKGHALATRKSYGAGHTVLITSPYMKKLAAKHQFPVQLQKLLTQIQSEVIPVKVSGDCHYLYNVMPDGSWKMLLMNNRGIVKRPTESFEKHFPEFTSEVSITLPAGATLKEIRRNAKPVVSRQKNCTVYKFKVAPAEIMVMDIKGLKTPHTRKNASKVTVKPVKKYKFGPYVPKIKNDGYRFDPEKNAMRRPATPAVIGRWRAADKFKDSSGNGHDLKYNNVKFKGDTAIFDTTRSYMHTVFPARYAVTEGTFELIVKPRPLADWKKQRKVVRGGVLYLGSVMLEYTNGTWNVLLFDRPPLYIRMWGSKGKPEWTHLAFTFKGSFCRFFINGKEVESPNGPLKPLKPVGINTFYNRIGFSAGSLQYSWPNPFSFYGEFKELTYFSRAMAPAEIAERAKKVR